MKKVYQQLSHVFTEKFRMLSAFTMSALVVTLLSATGASASSTSQHASLGASATYYACFNYKTSQIYVIQQNGKCKPGYTLIQWNQTGPQGPVGPQGPQGPAGVAVGYSAFNSNIHLAGAPGTVVAQTNTIGTSGTYYITASALLVIDSGDRGAFCYVASANNPNPDGMFGGTTSTGYQQASVSDALTVSAGDILELWCYSNGANPNRGIAT